MSQPGFSRRAFMASASATMAGALSSTNTACRALPKGWRGDYHVTSEDFARELKRSLPEEAPLAYHKKLSNDPVHIADRRNLAATLLPGEFPLPSRGWTLGGVANPPEMLKVALLDFQDYLKVSMGIEVAISESASLEGWRTRTREIVVGTRDQMPGCGSELKGPKDYEISISPERIVVCGYDARGAMYGLYNLEERMNLREAPFLPDSLHTVRHSLYDCRMVQSWMGWMEWPDRLLSHLSHDGFDAILASVYANPNNDRTTVETSTDFYARLMYMVRNQNPPKVRDLINRCARYGIKVYTQIMYQYMGTPESEAGLRKLTRDILKQFPDIQGYVLLTEGFWYKTWGSGRGKSREYHEDWARNWSKAVGIVAEECHRVNPDIEILPWEYNIDFRPQNIDVKRYFIQQLPKETIPLLTWENGKSFEIEGLQGFIRDYSISQVGPAEVTEAQIAEARKRGMAKVYTNADTFLCGAQLQTVPYHPFPYQWHKRYKALEKHGVNGTLESWSAGYTPNFMTELRSWHCWSDAPPLDDLLRSYATRLFGVASIEEVLRAWRIFSEAITLVPDTGPTWGTSNATGNPLFFQEPPARTATFHYAWEDHNRWMGYLGSKLNPHWPLTLSRLTFYPDFSNKTNRAENYARSSSGIESAGKTKLLPLFLKRLRQSSEKFGEGLVLYRQAALRAPLKKREQALREVIVAEQIQRMLQSNHAVLEFEDLRLQFVAEKEAAAANRILERMTLILREEIKRTELSLVAVNRDSRLGFQQECDYVFSPYSLNEKLKLLRETLDKQIPAARRRG